MNTAFERLAPPSYDQRCPLTDELAMTHSFQRPGSNWTFLVIGGMLAMQGTSSAGPNRIYEAAVDPTARPTSSSSNPLGGYSEAQVSTSTAIAELRRISGLTWEQLAALFNVSRRSIHFWASGNALNAENERRLLEVLHVVRDAWRGDARSTRTALLSGTPGSTPFDLLKEERYADAASMLGAGVTPQKVRPAALDHAEMRARKPITPAELLDARHETVHKDLGRGRPARTVKHKRSGRA